MNIIPLTKDFFAPHFVRPANGSHLSPLCIKSVNIIEKLSSNPIEEPSLFKKIAHVAALIVCAVYFKRNTSFQIATGILSLKVLIRLFVSKTDDTTIQKIYNIGLVLLCLDFLYFTSYPRFLTCVNGAAICAAVRAAASVRTAPEQVREPLLRSEPNFELINAHIWVQRHLICATTPAHVRGCISNAVPGEELQQTGFSIKELLTLSEHLQTGIYPHHPKFNMDWMDNPPAEIAPLQNLADYKLTDSDNNDLLECFERCSTDAADSTVAYDVDADDNLPGPFAVFLWRANETLKTLFSQSQLSEDQKFIAVNRIFSHIFAEFRSFGKEERAATNQVLERFLEDRQTKTFMKFLSHFTSTDYITKNNLDLIVKAATKLKLLSIEFPHDLAPLISSEIRTQAALLPVAEKDTLLRNTREKFVSQHEVWMQGLTSPLKSLEVLVYNNCLPKKYSDLASAHPNLIALFRV